MALNACSFSSRRCRKVSLILLKNMPSKAGSLSPKRRLSDRNDVKVEKDLISSPKSPKNRGISTVKSTQTSVTEVKSPGSTAFHEKLNIKSPKKDKSEKEAPASPTPSRKVKDAQTPSPGGKKATSSSSSYDPLHSPSARVQIKPRVEKVYKLIRNATGQLGGNGTTGAIYGELTMGSMQKVINLLVEKFDLNSQSRFIDVGSGLGKPNFHAAQDPECRISIGAELEKIRWQLAMYNLHKVGSELSRGKNADDEIIGDDVVTRDVKLLSGTNFIEADIDEAVSMDPFTHIYMYDLGFPPPLQQSIARKFNSSQYAECLVSYRPPRRVIEEYGYAVEFVAQLPTSMHGSGEGHMAYFYRRTNSAPKLSSAETADKYSKVKLRARPGMNEKDIQVLCDKLFAECVSLAAGDVEALRARADQVVDETLNAVRPRRERRPRNVVDV